MSKICKNIYDVVYDRNHIILNSMIETPYISLTKFIFPQNRVYNFLSFRFITVIKNEILYNG